MMTRMPRIECGAAGALMDAVKVGPPPTHPQSPSLGEGVPELRRTDGMELKSVGAEALK